MAKLYIGNTAYKVMLGNNSGHIADLPTVVWNQLVAPTTIQSQTINGVTITNHLDGSVTFVGKDTSSFRTWINFLLPASRLPLHPRNNSTHKYYVKIGLSIDTYSQSIFQSAQPTIVTGANLSQGNTYPRIYFSRNNEVNKTIRPVIFDLTYMFGAGNEPTSVAQFEQWFTDNIGSLDNYYPYNTGQEIKVKYLPQYM
jgi:hypothetical protein